MQAEPEKPPYPETVLDRLKVYHAQTEPLKEFYAQRGVLKSVENQPTIEDTAKAILRGLVELYPHAMAHKVPHHRIAVHPGPGGGAVLPGVRRLFRFGLHLGERGGDSRGASWSFTPTPWPTKSRTTE